MFTKIHYAFYDMLFEALGKLGEYFWQKSLTAKNELTKVRLEKRAWKCFDAREDIFDIMFVLKGLS
jgi:hypothetical protein